jgi:hypothetical protein
MKPVYLLLGLLGLAVGGNKNKKPAATSPGLSREHLPPNRVRPTPEPRPRPEPPKGPGKFPSTYAPNQATPDVDALAEKKRVTKAHQAWGDTEGYPYPSRAAYALETYLQAGGKHAGTIEIYQKIMGVPVTGNGQDKETQAKLDALLPLPALEDVDAAPPASQPAAPSSQPAAPPASQPAESSSQPASPSNEEDALPEPSLVPPPPPQPSGPPVIQLDPTVEYKTRANVSDLELKIHNLARKAANKTYQDAISAGYPAPVASAAYLDKYIELGGMLPEPITICQEGMNAGAPDDLKIQVTGIVDESTIRLMEELLTQI